MKKVYVPEDGSTDYNRAIIQRNQILGVIEKFNEFNTLVDDLDTFTKYDHIASNFCLPELREQLNDSIYNLNKEFRRVERIIINSR